MVIVGFGISEYFFGSYLGFDMEGLTKEQVRKMDEYEKLLVELGEKSYVPEDKQWSVEVRLLMTILMNTGMFIMGKALTTKLNTNMSQERKTSSQFFETHQRPRKRTMRPPRS